jgi:hypothetical protein
LIVSPFAYLQALLGKKPGAKPLPVTQLSTAIQRQVPLLLGRGASRKSPELLDRLLQNPLTVGVAKELDFLAIEPNRLGIATVALAGRLAHLLLVDRSSSASPLRHEKCFISP